MKNIVLLFPGQGSQYSGMGKELCRNFPVAMQTFDEAGEVLKFNLKELCSGGSPEELTRTENTQPAILALSVAAFRVYIQECGPAPVFSAGHSLGEISALTCAGAIKYRDALQIVRLRGRLMQEAVSADAGAMYAVSGIEPAAIDNTCRTISKPDNLVVISNYNSNEQIVISGHKAAADAAAAELKTLGAKAVPLKVSAPFHSPLMKTAADKFREELKKYVFGELMWPVLSNVHALPYKGPADIAENLTLQITAPVRWQESMEYLKDKNIDAAVELGPKNVLKNLLKKNLPSLVVFACENAEDVNTLKEKLGSKNPDNHAEKGFPHTVVTKCIAIAVCTRNRNWDNDEYQKGVVEPYRNIRKLQEKIESENRQPTAVEMQQALEMLRSVFVTKKTPPGEQNERFNQVFDETGTRELFKDFAMPAVNTDSL